MKRITAEELQVFLRKHKMWLANEPDGERVDLYGANLRGADLRGANLYGADLRGANLDGATGIPGIACPEEGEFIGWKKAYDVKSRTPCIVKLRITKDAKRSSATSSKCRCSKAIVEGIYTMNMKKSRVKTVRSNYNSNFLYIVGKTVEVSNFDDDRWNECAPGIHFFITKQEAIDY